MYNNLLKNEFIIYFNTWIDQPYEKFSSTHFLGNKLRDPSPWKRRFLVLSLASMGCCFQVMIILKFTISSKKKINITTRAPKGYTKTLRYVVRIASKRSSRPPIIRPSLSFSTQSHRCIHHESEMARKCFLWFLWKLNIEYRHTEPVAVNRKSYQDLHLILRFMNYNVALRYWKNREFFQWSYLFRKKINNLKIFFWDWLAISFKIINQQ